MQENRNVISVFIDGQKRYYSWKYPNRGNIYVSEFPRSGGTWFCQMIAAISGKEFYRNTNYLRPPAVLHAHYTYHQRFFKPIHVIRDGRDVMVSAYFYFLMNKQNQSALLKKWQRWTGIHDVENVKDNLTRFIYTFHNKYSVRGQQIDWGRFVDSYILIPDTLTIKYENLLINASAELSKALKWLNIHSDLGSIQFATELYSFEKQSNRKKGQENRNTFLRKGISGDWKNYFSSESCQLFDSLYGGALIRAGYESNRDWIEHSK